MQTKRLTVLSSVLPCRKKKFGVKNFGKVRSNSFVKRAFVLYCLRTSAELLISASARLNGKKARQRSFRRKRKTFMEKRPQIVCCTNLFPHGGNSNGVLHPFSRKRGNFIRCHSQSRFAAEVYPQVACFSFSNRSQAFRFAAVRRECKC